MTYLKWAVRNALWLARWPFVWAALAGMLVMLAGVAVRASLDFWRERLRR